MGSSSLDEPAGGALEGRGVHITRRGLMLVLSSPSGAGKTTLSRKLMADDSNLTMSISVTTRPKREAEVEGKDYYFTSKGEFDRMVRNGEFLEHATVFGNQYGTPRAAVEDVLSRGGDVLFDVDWQGTQQLSRNAPADLVSVFILPPSRQALAQRLKERAQDPPEVVASRMSKASDEMSHWHEYHYVIINEDIEESHRQLKAILQAERLRQTRQTGLADFVNHMREEI